MVPVQDRAAANGGDSFYDFVWRPTVGGTFTFQTLWKQGQNATADGTNLTGISNYSRITVR